MGLEQRWTWIHIPLVTFVHGAPNGLNAVEVSQCSLCNWLFSLFSRHISRTQSFQQNRLFNFRALVALKMLVSLISRLVACSPRIVVDKQTDRQTDTQNDYCNPRCACAPRVNHISSSFGICRGVRQGSVLSPTLFLAVMDILFKRLRESGHGLHVRGTYMGGAIHADDLRTTAASSDSDTSEDKVIKSFTTQYRVLSKIEYLKIRGSKNLSSSSRNNCCPNRGLQYLHL